jgi:hypothetical protein
MHEKPGVCCILLYPTLLALYYDAKATAETEEDPDA